MIKPIFMTFREAAQKESKLLYASNVKCKKHPNSLRLVSTNQCHSCIKAEYRKHGVTYILS